MIHSIKCRICTCRMTTVWLAQLDRVAKESYAQKVYEEFVSRPKYYCCGAAIFSSSEAQGFAMEGAYSGT